MKEIYIFHRGCPETSEGGITAILSTSLEDAKATLQEALSSHTDSRGEMVFDNIEAYDAAYAEGKTRLAGWYPVTSTPVADGMILIRSWER